MSTTLIVVTVVAVVLLYVVFVYNGLIRSRNQVDNAWSQIDVQLKRRIDLIPNLIETVKGYAAHEKSTLEAVINARNAAIAAPATPAGQAAADGLLTGALKQLFALGEAYPDLKANQNFLSLQGELADLENKLAAARRFFNNAVGEFNAVRRAFPTIVFAGLVGFGKDRTFFDVGDDSRAAMNAGAPQVKFN